MNIDNVYIEKRVENHSNTQKILERIKFQNIIICNSYSEVFNPSNQNFRIQKKFPSLILAKKENSFIKETPPDFTIGYKKITTFLICLTVHLIASTAIFKVCLTLQII